ncbi:DUF6193 family natural product biosynthesis protein [Candidatus Uabimicrobium amorphum]|uniref:Uncharacterized protein n=1 Tax=Uabimicrobium amorphum TaxID=2596890 RepID=A0A5S9F4C1_UABAM|nr:DUF6193 family natural product biosynthesis protein [Candidatus Uabimicrobium amorphum]BBM85626.1 hypothetical protein UABAM_04000 [Candidatus Uabimicrobium amorphum]
MRKEEQIARDLYEFLKSQCETCVEVAIEGAGVHWHVEAQYKNRRCRIHCMYYDNMDGLWLGMRGNAHLRGSTNDTPQITHRGVEYLISFHDNDDRICEGRTYDYNSIYGCIRGWIIACESREKLYEKFDFIDKNTRTLKALGKQIDASQKRRGSKWRTCFEPSYTGDVGVELWVYAQRYSCRICTTPSNTIRCSFFINATLLASQDSTIEDIETSVYLWTDQQITLDKLQQKFPQLQIRDFARVFERGDYSDWHWQNVLQQARSGDEVLEYYLPILEEIVVRPEIKCFFSFTSLNRLCFSRCSHYPFMTEGLPVLFPTQEGCFAHCGEYSICGNYEVICNFLSEHLERLAQPAPFVGTIRQFFISPLNKALEKLHSDVRMEHVQQNQWSRVQAAKNNYRCGLEIYEEEENLYGIYFSKDDSEIALGRFASVDATAVAINKWLNHGSLPPQAQDLKDLV